MKKLLSIFIVLACLLSTARAQTGWETQVPKDCFCCNDKIYNLPTKPPITGPDVLRCDSASTFTTLSCPGAQIQWTISPALSFTGQGTSSISITGPYAATVYTITVTIRCGSKIFSNQRVVKVNATTNCTAKFMIVITELSNGNFRVDATPSTGAGVWHYWGAVGNGNGATCTHTSLAQIQSGGTFGASVSPTGVFTPVGMGTGINHGPTSLYGYQYSGFGNQGCYKLTHYVLCCDGWYRQTQCFCISQTANEAGKKLPLEGSVPNSSAKIKLIKPYEIRVTESALEKVPEKEIPADIKEMIKN